MRRGRPGVGWRSDNPRHFRPRNSGVPHYRPPRNFGLIEHPRFPPPGILFNRPPHFVSRQIRPEHDHLPERNNYNHYSNIQHRLPNRNQHYQKQIQPYNHNQRPNNEHYNSYPGKSLTKHNETFSFSVNEKGDVDHRHPGNISSMRENYPRHTTWINPALDSNHYSDQSPQKYYKHNESLESKKSASDDYAGHRPPSSDHYGGNCNPNNNNTVFSRSVDDTVDIIRKKLRDRSDGQPLPSQESLVPISDNANLEINKTYPDNHQEQPTKKKIQRPTQGKSNCDKIKTNIVHQLFKMDKNKIHKLLDNPSSSTKFEYAISSLITESQNSLNRQLRSVAEKSLSTSNSGYYINDDNNTIYEDTFMKQMQCILDPQDTVFLEDIKPIVMAELNKVLHLDDYVQVYDMHEGNQTPYQSSEHSDLTYYNDLKFDDEPYNYENKIYDQEQATESFYNKSNDVKPDVQQRAFNQDPVEHPENLIERRTATNLEYTDELVIDRRQSTESQRHMRKSIDLANEEKFKNAQEVLPLFDTNNDQLSEDEEDCFAELDRQYHVAVDDSFMRNDEYNSPQQSIESCISKSPNSQTETINKLPTNIIPTSDVGSINIKQEIDLQLENLAKSPLKFNSSLEEKNNKSLYNQGFQETFKFIDSSKEDVYNKTNNYKMIVTKQEPCESEIVKDVPTKDNELNKEAQKSEHANIVKVSAQSNSRKRSVDQIPSHRKEKRKKSGSSPTNLEHISNKNETMLVEDLEATKLLKMLSSNEINSSTPKVNKNVDSVGKTSSVKHVKRKKEITKSKDNESSKKHNSTSSNHSILSQKEYSSSLNSQTPNKSDAKLKLQTIDMFIDVPKKATSHHQAHRNTASAPVLTAMKSPEESKTKSGLAKLASKVSINHVSTQVMRKVHTKETQTTISRCSKSKFSQTERKKFTNKFVQTDTLQTDLVPSPKKTSKATDSFERMKEIDLEIQVLLQEKFKLYNSMESGEMSQNSVQTLGLAVLSMKPLEEEKPEDTENTLTEDAIVDSFANIPVEELEQIAYETVEYEKKDLHRNLNLVHQQVPLAEHSQISTSATVTKSGRKVNTPNISLLEQIITSDKPLEDIIVLDELEDCPSKSTKKKSQRKRVAKKKSSKKSKTVKAITDYSSFNLKECTVVIERLNINQYLILPSDLEGFEKRDSNSKLIFLESVKEEVQPQKIFRTTQDEVLLKEDCVDMVDNDIHLDMLDVSEDIVIGDICEVKFEDKDTNSKPDESVSEDVILDNSQSSCEDLATADTCQEKSVCKMFDYSTDENLQKDSITVSGNADAVLAIEGIENNFIAACLDGNVYYISGDGQLLNTLRGSNLAVTCLTIVKEKYGTTVYTGSLDSRIRYYDLSTGLEKGPECNVLSPIQTMDLAWGTVFVGTRTGFVLQFECKNNLLIPVSTVKFSEQSILALRAIKEGPRKVLLVAARSENVTIKDAQTGLLLRSLQGPAMTVYTLLFEDGKVYCGTSSHQVHVFDYASGSHVGTHEGGKGAVCLRASGGLLFAGCYDGCVYVYREGEPQPLAQLRGPSLMLLSLAIVGTKIIAGYKDRSLYIWKIPLSILQEMIL